MQILSDILPLLTNASVIGFVVIAVLYGGHFIAQHFKWSDERWMGIVHAAILSVRATGVQFGPVWLQAAEDAFEAEYEKTHGQAPTAEDLRDGVLDMARTVGPQALAILGKDIAASLLPNSTTTTPPKP